jgi:hypothetical protein
MCTWPVGVKGPCHSKTVPCIAINQPYVNATMMLDYWHQDTQGSMVVEQSNHLLPSYHLNNRCACGHGIWVYRDPVAVNQLLALPFTNHMWIQPCCLIPSIMLHNAAWWWNGQTTNFYHTTSITTLHVHMASGCSGTLLQQTSSLPSN